jgi:hypothetical protein
MKLEDIKKEMRLTYFNSGRYDYVQAVLACEKMLDKLDLPDPDAKLRKVREEIERLTCYSAPQSGYSRCYKDMIRIIDSHLAPTEPVDQELLDAQKRFPVGSWFNSSSFEKAIYCIKEVIRKDHVEKYLRQVLIVDFQDYEHEIAKCTPSPLWISEPRCCVTDAPDITKETKFLVWVERENKFSIITRYFDYNNDEVWGYTALDGDVWYELPKQGGE